MILHQDGSPILQHFIRPEHLIALLEKRAFHLIRQDRQSDLNDGKLPNACFEKPFRGELERGLGMTNEFLKNQAHGIHFVRLRTFIMSWTHDPTERVKSEYGENGKRCEIQTSMLNLKKMLGYKWPNGCEFPPREIPIKEIPGSTAIADLKIPYYTDGNSPISVVPSYFVTAHKSSEPYFKEHEIRIEAVIYPLTLDLAPSDILITWPLETFKGLNIKTGTHTSLFEKDKIARLSKEMSIEAVTA